MRLRSLLLRPMYSTSPCCSAHRNVLRVDDKHDLTVLVTKLNDRIDGLETDLQHTKKTYSTALTKLVLRVKKLEYKLYICIWGGRFLKLMKI
ncbi:hypothetical protein Tco_0067128 [Tanacetum coccineum]